MAMSRGETTPEKILVGPGVNGGIKLISHIDIMNKLEIFNYIKFSH